MHNAHCSLSFWSVVVLSTWHEAQVQFIISLEAKVLHFTAPVKRKSGLCQRIFKKLFDRSTQHHGTYYSGNFVPRNIHINLVNYFRELNINYEYIWRILFIYLANLQLDYSSKSKKNSHLRINGPK